jgi:hypothetical protein
MNERSTLIVLIGKQRFDAGDVSGRKVDLRLIVQLELVALQCTAQTRFQRETLERVGVELLGIELKIVLSLSLRLVHRDVGVLHERRFVAAVLRISGDTHACRDSKLLPEQHQRTSNRCENLMRDGAGVIFLGDLRQQDDELVTAQSRDDVVLA